MSEARGVARLLCVAAALATLVVLPAAAVAATGPGTGPVTDPATGRVTGASAAAATATGSLALSSTSSGADAVTGTVTVTARAAASLTGLRVVLPTGTSVSGQRVTVTAGRAARTGAAVVETAGTLRVTLARVLPVAKGQLVRLVLTGLANPPNGARFNARVDLLGSGGAPTGSATFPVSYTAAPACGAFRGPGWVASENSRPGRDWRIPSGYSDIEGYADRASTQCGESVTLKVSTTTAWFGVAAFRMGWYAGAGARLVWQSDRLAGEVQPGFVVHSATRTVVAPWRPSLVLKITGGWPPGQYLLRLTSASGRARFIPLTIRDDASTAPVALQVPVMTWQAYNAWGGYSLYRGPADDPTARAVTVSFDRPYQGDGLSEFGDGQFVALDQPFVAFAESKGVNLTYLTDVDVDANPALLARHRALVLPTHDEYWTPAMRAALEAAVGRGMNLLTLGANAVYWKSALDVSAHVPRRNLTVYRTADLDPAWGTAPSLVTNRWRDAPVARPEAQLLGVMYDCINQSEDGVVTAPSSWVFAGTGVQDLDTLSGVVTGENDRYFPGAAPTGLQILAHATFGCAAHGDLESGWDMTYYTNSRHAGVLSVGTMGWICNLDATCANHPGDPGMQRVVRKVTANVLAAFAAGPAGIRHPAVPNAAGICSRLGCVGLTTTPGGIAEPVTQG
jgi:hypothetical protein